MYIQNKYHQTYFNIIHRAQNRELPKTVKKEIHHILPRSLGGSDDPINLVSLTLKEHWICHRLLVKFLKDKKHIRKMYNALFMMTVKDYRTINGRIYQQIKENIEPWNKGMVGLYTPPLSAESKEALSKLWKDKKRPQEHIDAMRAGWNRIKEEGYVPWNKGVKGLKGPCKAVTLIDPQGKHYYHESLKKGCQEHNLIYTKMSGVNNGHYSNYKGWTILTPKKVPINTP
jgi:hypothetical protein